MTSSATPGFRARLSAALRLAWLLAWLTGLPAHAADLQRGARLFATPPAAGLLACIDCHSENPQVSNFGNIFVGRNASALIERAVLTNTGGMGYFRGYLDDTAFADIAAWLGNTPGELDFGVQPSGTAGPPRSVTVSASSKAGLGALRLGVEGDFAITTNRCGSELPARQSCTVDLVFKPQHGGAHAGALLIVHDGLPSAARVVLRGEAVVRPPATTRLQPATLHFAGAGTLQVFSLANVSPDLLLLHAIRLDGPGFEIAGGSCAGGLVLAGGASCVLALRRTGAAASGGTVTVDHDGAGGASVATLVAAAGGGPAPLRADPAVVDFGVLPESGLGSAVHTVWLHPLGPAAWRLQALQVAGEAFGVVEGGSCRAGTLMAAGGSCHVLLRYQGQQRGAAGGELRVVVEGAAAPLTVPLSGRGPDRAAARPSFSAAPLLLQTVPGHLVTRRLWLRNAGPGALRLGALSISGDAAADLRASGSCTVGRELSAGQRCEIELAYAPQAAGLRHALLQLVHDGPGGGSTTALRALAAATLWADRATIEFGARALSTLVDDATEVMSLHNRGPTPVTLTRLQTVGDAAADFPRSGSCGAGLTIEPGAGCTVELRFAPSAAGLRSATVVAGWAGPAPPLLLGLGGVGVATPPPPAAPPPEVAGALRWQAERAGPSHPETAVGDAAVPVPVRLVNHGSRSQRIAAMALAGEAAAEFAIDPSSGCRAGVELPAGASCEALLHFHPAASGWRRAILTMWADGEAPLAMALAARALAPVTALPALQPPALVFDSRSPGLTGARLAVLVNRGTAAMELQPGAPSGEGFAVVEGGAGACPASASSWLLPGQSCTLNWIWTGTAAAQRGAQATALGDGMPVTLTLAVTESAQPRSNVGAGSFASAAGLAGLLALALAAWALASERRRDSAESPP